MHRREQSHADWVQSMARVEARLRRTTVAVTRPVMWKESLTADALAMLIVKGAATAPAIIGDVAQRSVDQVREFTQAGTADAQFHYARLDQAQYTYGSQRYQARKPAVSLVGITISDLGDPDLDLRTDGWKDATVRACRAVIGALSESVLMD